MSRLRMWFGAFALFVPLSAGCGSDVTTVTGTVVYQGRAVPSGAVVLFCEDKRIFHGPIAEDGRYTIPNVPRGPAVITVQTLPPKPYTVKHRLTLPAATNGPVPPVGGFGSERVVPIPLRYAVPEESGLSVTVEGKLLTHDIELRP